MEQNIFTTIERLADKYAAKLKKQVHMREKEMERDDISHYLLYRVLGVTDEERLNNKLCKRVEFWHQ